GSLDSSTSLASSSAPVSVFDEHRFRKAHNQQLFESYAKRRKVIPEVGSNLTEDEYPQIMEQIALRGWRRLTAPRTSISKLLVQEFYANAAVSDEEVAGRDELPYKSFVRGKEVNFSPSNIRRIMRFKMETAGAETDYNTRKAIDQRLDEVLSDLCVPGATWKLSSSQPADAGVPLREFIRTPRIPKLSYIMARRMETIRFPRNQPQQQHEEDDEDEPMPQADGGNNEEEDQQLPQQDHQPQQHAFPNFQPRYESQYHEDLQGIEETLSSMQFFQQTFYENMQKSQEDYMEEVKQLKEKQEQIYNHNQRFHSQIWKEQEKLAKEIQEIRRSQLAQTMANNKRLETEKNMQLALERQGRDIVEMRRQINLWANNTSSKEAYACWAQQ
ncbi:hypothetical protein PIB30_104096, partial [Stylosanthes scabra]|nr:hypothetical protein [Stylosanthes scabra]